MRLLAVIGLTAALCACNGPITTAQQASEKVDTEAADLYVAVATYLNSDETANPGNVAKDEAFKLKAWKDYQLVHAAYLDGQILTVAILATLTADQTTAKGS